MHFSKDRLYSINAWVILTSRPRILELQSQEVRVNAIP